VSSCDQNPDPRSVGPGTSVAAQARGAGEERRIANVIEGLLMDAHRQNRRLPIEGPGSCGAFPTSGGRAWGLLAAGVPPVVADANPLRNDILRACRTGRTVLITAANVGAIRLFTASHVIDEVHRHGSRWARESGDVSPSQLWTRWREEYLPLLRVIDNRHLSVDLLDHEERGRLSRLANVDHGDVPSVILSLVLGAFFLSEDHAAVRAVYGENVDLEAHRGWLSLLRSSGDAGELGKMVFAASMLPTIAGGGVIEAGRWVSRKLSPWALMPFGLALVLLVRRHLTPERLSALRSSAVDLAGGFVHVYLRYQREYERFRAAAAPAPSWIRLSTEAGPRAVLTRACMYALARTPGGQRPAAELANELPELGVGQGEVLVREILRREACFMEVYAGRWQMGSTAAPRRAESRIAVDAGTAAPTVSVALRRMRGERGAVAPVPRPR
jgi:hypothetical protein